jgi:hypothetical protein
VGSLAHKDAVEVQKPKHCQRLLAGTQDCHLPVIGSNGLEESDDCAHACAVDYAKLGQIHEELSWSLVHDLADGRSEVENRDGIELALNAQNRRSIL